MLMFTNCLRPVAYLVIGVLTLALGQSANAQGCRGGGGGGGMGGSGMMGGGYSGGGFMGGMGQSPGMMGGNSGGGYGWWLHGWHGAAVRRNMGGGYMGQSSGMMGGYQGQSPNSPWSQNYSGTQQAGTSCTNATVNNPSTVLAHRADLNLTSKQVQLLEKMVTASKQHAAFVLTQAQRRQLAEIVGPVRKSRST